MLKFHPAPGMMAMIPGSGHGGQPTRYVGRKLDQESGKHIAVAEAFECPEDSPLAPRMLKLAVRGEVLVSDAHTAGFCGVKFIPVSLKDGEFQPATEAKASRKGTE